MRFFLILLTLLVYSYYVFGLENSDFNQLYARVSILREPSDIKQAQIAADSLAAIAVNDEERIKAIMLSANLYFKMGDVGNAIMQAMKANRMATTALDTNWDAITSGFLATAFRGIGLLKASERYLMLSEKANEAAAHAPMYTLTKINLLHELALHKFTSKNYSAAESILQQARELIVHGTERNERTNFVKAANSRLLAHCYLHQDQLALADDMLQETLKLMDADLRPYVYQSIAELEMKKGNLQQSYHYLNLTLPYLKSAGIYDLKISLYHSFMSYYFKSGDLEKSNAYVLKAMALEKDRINMAYEVSDKLLENINAVKEDYKHKYQLAISIAFFLVSALISILMYLYLFKKKQQVSYQLLKNTPPEIEKISVNNASVENNTSSKIKDVQIAEDTEARLLHGLCVLENEHFFLEKSVSLNSLALLLGSNQRYVSYIIRKYRGKDFYPYIQSKRIEYIVTILKEDATLLDYKLSHLADISGFSTPSKFSIAFKNEMGVPPSAFVNLLKIEKPSDKIVKRLES